MSKKKAKKKRRRIYTRRFRRRNGKQPISLLTALPVVNATFLEPILGNPSAGIDGALAHARTSPQEGLREFIDVLSINWTGYKPSSGSWHFLSQGYPVKTYGLILMGWLGSKVATYFGANRVMRKIPIVGKYLKL